MEVHRQLEKLSAIAHTNIFDLNVPSSNFQVPSNKDVPEMMQTKGDHSVGNCFIIYPQVPVNLSYL